MDHFLQLKNVSKTFGEVAALRGVDFEVGSQRDRGAARRQRRGEVHPRQDHHRLPPPRPRRRALHQGEEGRAASPSQRPATWASRSSTRSAPSPTSSRCGGTSSWAGSSPTVGAGSTCARMRRETRKLMGTLMGFTSSAVTPESVVKTFSGGERQGVAITRALYFKAELHHPRRADHGPFALRNQEMPRLRRGDQEARARRRSSSTTTSSTSTPWPTGSWCWTGARWRGSS